MNYQKIWGIVGLGWLGQSLSENLNSHGVKTWGTHRADFDWRIHDFPKRACDVLFLNTPPLADISPEDFVAKIPAREQIIFISSISVYGDQSGILTESTLPLPRTASGKWLATVEQLLIKKFPEEIIIIRPGGLIGGNRHPAFHLSKSQSPVSADTPVNLIHREDLINIICTVSESSKPPLTINAVAPAHPRKEDYYGELAKKLGLAPIHFIKTNEPHKIIESDYLLELYPDWVYPNLNGDFALS
ncbi:Rossmann-fold NAD(P)-binding domain-containing protein [Bdellovibrio reynosensis]|uniref:SDR family NAD(P)-dependent oxidoreductase n=1 Tax=Bdellovibrio reynosensis TaxID=2835041 RepID=A0ABY4C8V8_9BACT|nr:SDR family NAD(P)-dependent oxidoreductase [Bdellovibrio reynosensis]UOF01370.1 SDR family NAD(P)-dependent oxidoreductase [Bdellovibrio reynosensis]